jgi:hypothetical protein
MKNGALVTEECIAEVFMAKKYQVLFLIYPANAVTSSTAIAV